MHVAVFLLLAVLALSTAGRAQSDRPSQAPAGDPIAIPMTADHWQTKVERCRRTSVSPLIPITFSRMRMGCAGMPRRKQRIPPHSSSIVARSSVSHKSASDATAERLPPMFSRHWHNFPDDSAGIPRWELIVAPSTYLECIAATDADQEAKRRRTNVGGL
jgi:hypothetical protein